MKYIRTKEGIIDITNKEIINPNNVQFYTSDEIKNGIWIDDIIKQADNIKYLCDEFVPVKKGEIKGYRFVFVDDLFEYFKVNDMLKDYDIYGAIWTEWGLKYVSKLNSKGELELI